LGGKNAVLQKILVPLDGSELAETVLPYVEEICQRCEPVEVILFQVVPPPPGRSGAVYRALDEDFPTVRLPETPADVATARHPIYRDQELASARAEVEVALARAIQRLCDGGINIRVDVAFGRPADEIVDFAEREGVDLIAMSTHGRSGLTRWIFGSVTDKVLHGTHVPILLVRPPGMPGMPFPPQHEIEL
jgi:nucleotide-binding universal stress UspA family protein